MELRTESQSEGTGEEELSSIDAPQGGLERRVLPGPDQEMKAKLIPIS